MCNFLIKFDNFLDKTPNIKKIIFALAGIKSVSTLLILAGITAISNPISLFAFIWLFIPNHNLDLKDAIEPNVIQFSIGVIFIILGSIVTFYKNIPNNSTSQATPSFDKDLNIKRIKDLPLFTKWCSFSIVLLILIVLLIIFMFVWRQGYKNNLGLGNLIWIILFLRIILILILIYLIYFVANILGCILYLIRGNKLVLLANKKMFLVQKNLFLELGKDGYLYLTEYDFTKCNSCQSDTYLDRKDKQHYLICVEYGCQKGHVQSIDPAKFDKFSNP